MKKYFFPILITLIVFFGFYFRFTGIEKQLSYWNDESHVAIFSRSIIEHGSPTNEIGYSTKTYQWLLYYITAISFRLFGINEFAGRLPSVLIGTLIIWIIYFISKKIFNKKIGLLSAFLIAFSQIQIAWSTQLRPYIWIEFFTLLNLYFCYFYVKNKNNIIDKNLFISFVVSLISGLFHGTGLINLIFLGFCIFYKSIKTKNKKGFIFIPIIILIGSIIAFQTIKDINFYLNINTELTHYKVFFKINYWWLLLFALLGEPFLYKKDKDFFILSNVLIFFILFVAIFKLNNNYVRYSFPVFAIFYIYFSIGLLNISKIIAKKNYLIIVLITLALITLKTNKFIISPQYYYSINADMRENPIVDYKETFKKIKDLMKNKKDVIIFDAWNDRVPWYLPKQKFIFIVDPKSDYTKTKYDPFFGEEIISSTEKIREKENQYKYGIFIIENWESITPENIKQFIKQKYKHQFDIKNLPYNENDKWSVSVYSWGM